MICLFSNNSSKLFKHLSCQTFCHIESCIFLTRSLVSSSIFYQSNFLSDQIMKISYQITYQINYFLPIKLIVRSDHAHFLVKLFISLFKKGKVWSIGLLIGPIWWPLGYTGKGLVWPTTKQNGHCRQISPSLKSLIAGRGA